ncbi:hypothetical protein FSHL1_000239 [Fusarium sambucinum]
MSVPRPDYERPITLLPADEVEQRRDFAIMLQEKLNEANPEREVQLTSVHLAALLTMPKENLEHLREFLIWISHTSMTDMFGELPGLVTRFVSPATIAPPPPSAPPALELIGNVGKTQATQRAGSSRPSNASKKKRNKTEIKRLSKKGTTTSQRTSRASDPDAGFLPTRKDGTPLSMINSVSDEKALCRQRDGDRCIFMQTADGEVAHIIPQSWNSNIDNTERTRQFFEAARLFMSPEQYKRCEKLLVPTSAIGIGTSDKAWNMLYLERQLHRCLDSTNVGFKCLRVTDHPDGKTATVTIQFHWHLRRMQPPDVNVTLEGEGNHFDKMVESIRKFDENPRPARTKLGHGNYAAMRTNNHAPLISGHLAHIEMSSDDAQKCKAMLDLAWHLGVVGAMSGAAEWPELPSDDDDDDWDELRQRNVVEQWLEDQFKLTEEERGKRVKGKP